MLHLGVGLTFTLALMSAMPAAEDPRASGDARGTGAAPSAELEHANIERLIEARPSKIGYVDQFFSVRGSDGLAGPG